jgi:hypothetical protein
VSALPWRQWCTPPLQFAESVRKSPGRTTQSPRSPDRNTENCFIWAFSAHYRWIRGVSIKATGGVPIRQGLRPITASRALIGCIVRCDYRAFPRFRSRARVAVNPPPPPPPPDLIVDGPMAAEVDQKGSCDFPFALCVPISFLFPPPSPLLNPEYLFPRDCSGGARALDRRRADSEAIQIQGAGCSIPSRHIFYSGSRFYYFACTSYVSSLLWVYPAR